MIGSIYMPDLPRPNAVEQLDYEQIFQTMKNQFNGYQPMLLDAQHRPHVLPATLVELDDGQKVWQVPASPEMGLYYLDLESDPIVRQLQITAYHALLHRQRVNNAAHAVMPAYTEGKDQDELYKILKLERLKIKDATDTEPAIYESDDAYRRRYELGFDQFTTAGSEESYIFHALSADGKVKDATGYAPDGAEAVVTILSHEGDGTASNTLLETVKQHLSAAKLRPISDELTVQTAEIRTYTINARFFFEEGPSPQPVIDTAKQNLEQYIKNQHRLGGDIERSALNAQCHLPGVHHVDFDMDLPIRCNKQQAPFCLATNLSYGGRDD